MVASSFQDRPIQGTHILVRAISSAKRPCRHATAACAFPASTRIGHQCRVFAVHLRGKGWIVRLRSVLKCRLGPSVQVQGVFDPHARRARDRP